MSIRIKKALLAVFGALLALSVAVFGLSLKTKGAEAAEIVTGESKTVSVTEAYTFTGDDMTNKTAALSTGAYSSWTETLGMTKFSNTFSTADSKFYIGFEDVDASKYSYVTFRALIWAEGKTYSFADTEIYTAANVLAYNTQIAYSWADATCAAYPLDVITVSIPVSALKNENGKVSGLIIRNPVTTDTSGWFMVSDVTFVCENAAPIDYDSSYGLVEGTTSNLSFLQDSWGDTSWKTEGLRNRVRGLSSDKAFDVTIKFATPVFAADVTHLKLKMLGWESAKTVNCTIKNLDGTQTEAFDVAFAYTTSVNLDYLIPTAGLENSDGKIEGFILSSPSGATNFVFSDITVIKGVEQLTEAGITANNVTFKMGGAYGESVYYELSASWTNTSGAGWIVNATPTKGDVNMRLSISEETSSGGNGGSRLGLVRMPNLDSNWANEFGLFDVRTVGANDYTFSTGIWAGKTEFLMAYNSSNYAGTIKLVGTTHDPFAGSTFLGKLATYEAAKDCEYFGLGFLNRAYSLKAKIQIYDANNNDLGVNASLWDRASYSCNLTGKVGETIYFTPATAGTPTVTTAGGESIAVTAGENGVYSFVMPAEAVTVAAAPEVETEITFTVNGETKKTEKITWNEENFVAAIPSVSVADTQVVGYEYEGKLYKTGAAVFAAIGTPAEAITVNIVALHLETVDGAEVRASGTADLRFTSAVGKSVHVSAYGMILTVKTNVDDSGEGDGVGLKNFTKENLDGVGYKYIDTNSSETDFKSYEKDENVMFSLVLTNIRDSHRDLQYVARTYVTVVYEGGETVTYYSEIDFENNARSAHDVATSSIENKELNGLTVEQIAFLEENYLKKA